MSDVEIEFVIRCLLDVEFRLGISIHHIVLVFEVFVQSIMGRSFHSCYM